MNAILDTTLLSFEDVDLLVAQKGSGPPLVFVHGYTCTHDLWHEPVSWFSREYRCVAYDLRGHGGSSSPGTGYGVQDYTRDLLHVMDSLQIESATVVGFSMGGGIALSAALSHPERVKRLVLVSSTVGGVPWEEGMWKSFREFESQARQIGVQLAIDQVWFKGPLFASVKRYPALIGRLRQMALQFSGGNIFDKATYAKQDVPESQRLGEIHCPTLILKGENDPPEFVRRSTLLASAIPGARQEVIAGAGHFSILEQPVAFHRAVDRFLKESAA